MSATYEKWNGIQVSPETRKRFGEFEAQYAHLRAQEGRVYEPDEIKRLPVTVSDHPHHAEWELRRRTIDNFLEYIREKGRALVILDIGCGNGFFSNLMAKQGHKVIATDVSLFELEQAANLFGHENPAWYYADVMSDELPLKKFDLITLNAVLAYFADPRTLIQRCLEMLKHGGELHILDSPIYASDQAAAIARENSQRHFQTQGSPGMMHFYHFHTWEVLKGFDYSVQLKIAAFMNKLLRLKRSPFPWIIIKKS